MIAAHVNKNVTTILLNYSINFSRQQRYALQHRSKIHSGAHSFIRFIRSTKSNLRSLLKWAINPGLRNLADHDEAKYCKVTPKMDSTEQSEFMPPESVRGMNILNRDAFSKQVNVPTLIVRCDKLSILKNKKHKKKSNFNNVALKIRGLKSITELPESNELKHSHKALLIKPPVIHNGKLKEDALDILKPLLGNEKCPELMYMDLTLTYDNWHYSDILKAVLPENSTGIGGFALVGHILHLNLKEDLLQYKSLIGHVLLDKVPTVKTVVNKLNIIDNTFRNFQMEVLAGEPDFITTVKEHGSTYKMDFSKVYWNSRLSQEHTRIVKELNAGDIVFDAFAGIGPFAIPAAKKNCQVFANDLNPESYRWLNENIAINKVKNVKTFNLDGRDFLKTMFKGRLVELMTKTDKGCECGDIHIVMNLPALAIEFTDVFNGLLSDTDKSTLNLSCHPKVHCYCFSKEDDLERDVRERIEAVMQWSLPSDAVIRYVRNVAPNKEMMCASFHLSENVLFGSQTAAASETDSPPLKKLKEDIVSKSNE